MTKIYYCVELATLTPISAGRLPDVWGNITGLSGVSDSAAADLSWAGYPTHGFLTRAAAETLGAAVVALDAVLSTGAVVEGDAIRADRDTRLAETVDRLNPIQWESFSESQKNAWRAYRTSLLAIPEQAGFPWEVTWPTPPFPSS